MQTLGTYWWPWRLSGCLACSLLVYKRGMNSNSLEQHVVCKCSYQKSLLPHPAMPSTLGKASPHEKGTLWLTAPPGLPGGMFYTAPENSLIMNLGVVPEGRSYSLQKGNAFLPHFHLHLPNSRLCRSISDTPLSKDAGACRLLWVFNST